MEKNECLRAEIKLKRIVELPQVPNYIRCNGGSMYPIEEFDEKTLQAIGRQWTKELIAKSKKKNITAGA